MSTVDKRVIRIGVLTFICVGLLIAGILFPIFTKEGDRNDQSTGDGPTGTKLTTYEEQVIEPGTNQITGLTNEEWFGELLTDEQLTFATDALGSTEFNSSENDDRNSELEDDYAAAPGDGEGDKDNADLKTSEETEAGGASLPREIEEADIIKLVDDTLYVLNTYRGLMIIDVSTPDVPKLASRVPLFGHPVEMYIVEPRAYVILTHYYNAFLWTEDAAVSPEYRHGSEIVIIDITDHEKPTVQQYIELEGFITNTRRVGEVIYAVANTEDGYFGILDGGGISMDGAIREEATRTRAEVAEEDTKNSTEPGVPETPPDPDEDQAPEEKDVPETSEKVAVDDDDEDILEPQEGTIVVSINMENLDEITEVDRVLFPGESNEIHVTEQAIFVAQPEYDDSWNMFEIDEEEKVDYYTKVTYVDISDYHGEIKVRDTFEVAGHLEDRYQMDYYDNTFRIVTHFEPDWSDWDWDKDERPLGSSTLWIYDTSNPDEITKLGDLAIDDAGTLMATRFAGERAYTIHLPYSIDPLDVLDLSDPKEPVLTDILEMPGWVTHMEVRGLKILALGVDDSDGQQRVAVSLFDVTDPENAVMEDRVIIGDGYSWSTANWDPKALSVIDDQNLILVPFESYSNDKDGMYRSYSGLQIVEFDLDKNDLVAGGVIEHMGGIQRTRATSERIFAISYRHLQVIDATDRDKPKVTAMLELCSNIVDIIPMGEYCVQVVNDYDYNAGSSVTKLRTVPADEPDTTNYLVEKSMKYNVVRTYINDKIVYLVCNEYLTEEKESQGRVLIYDYSDPKVPVLRSDFVMEYYQEGYYYGYYDMYSYGSSYYGGGGGMDYTFSLVDGDILVYHPRPDQPDRIYYYEDEYEYEYDEENRTEEIPREDEKSRTRAYYYEDVNLTEIIYMIDLSDPDSPTDAGNITLENTSRITGMYTNGKTLYLVQYHQEYNEAGNYGWEYNVKYYMTKLDLTTPASPKLQGPISIPGEFLGVNDAGTVIYTRTTEYDENYYYKQTLNVLSLSGDTATLANAIDLGSAYPNIMIQDTAIILSYNNYNYYRYDDYYYEDGVKTAEKGMPDYGEPQEPIIKTKIQIIDAQDPASLKLKTTIGLKNYGAIYKFEDNKLYIQLSDANGLLIYDISDIGSPEFMGYYPIQGWLSSLRVDPATGKVYMACGMYGVLTIELWK